MNTLKNITPLGWLGIVLIINSVITGSVNEMTDLLGAIWAKHAISLAVIGSGVCGGLVTMFSTQGAQVRNVRAMDGVENIDVNAKANPALAALAMDPNEKKISVIPGAQAQVAATAKAAS
jgi:hypothetical protein